jgi:negative regulator of replication initiation
MTVVNVNGKGMLHHMTVRTTISMPDEIWDQVEKRQNETGASTSEIVRRALTAFFDGTSKPRAAKAPLKAVKAPAKTTKPPAKRVSKRVAKAS